MRTPRARAVALPAVLLLAAGLVTGLAGPASPSGAAPASQRAAATTHYNSWIGYHGGRFRHGDAFTMPPVSGAPVVSHQVALDGAVYASPLVIKGVTIVATENNTVYAFSPSYRLLWKHHLGAPSPAGERPCGNIDPLGITGTPAYFSRFNSIYVSPELGGARPQHQLVSLNFDTGAVKWRADLDLPGVDPTVMQQRGAIAITESRVWVPFGGLAGDCGDYKGRLVGVSRYSGGYPRSYTVPTEREAGMWATPGVVADRNENMYVAVGNGASGVGDPYDYSDSILRVSAATSALVSSFSPANWAQENDGDVDLGSQGATVLANWVFAAGKSGEAYVLHRYKLGGIGGQVSHRSLCRSFGGTAAVGSTVFVPCTDGLRKVSITSTGQLRVLWHAASNVVGSPVLGGGRVWALDVSAGRLYALDRSTGAIRSSVAVGAVSRFATPAIYGRTVTVPTLAGFTTVRTS